MGFVRFPPTDYGTQMVIEIAFYDITPDELAKHPDVKKMIANGLTLKLEGVNCNEEPESSHVQEMREKVSGNTPEISL